MSFSYQNNPRSAARLGVLKTPHGALRTPFFMPIATRGVVKTLSAAELEDASAQLLLANTYHLLLRPGPRLIKKIGGLHPFMNWTKPILTDSGGFQVFSLAANRQISDQGVKFQSPSDGSTHLLTPEISIQTQIDLGVDLAMAFDECPPYPCSAQQSRQAVARTYDWAQRSRRQFFSRIPAQKPCRPKLFGIIQGSTDLALRRTSLAQITSLNFDGYALGGLAVGEPTEIRQEIITAMAPLLPPDKPRYLMGLGKPEEIVFAVNQGIDMFDCVIPTRNGRHGLLYQWRSDNLSDSDFYRSLNIKNSLFFDDQNPVDRQCPCPLCRQYSRSYLHYLFKIQDPLGPRLASIHNLTFYLSLMKKLRHQIATELSIGSPREKANARSSQ